LAEFVEMLLFYFSYLGATSEDGRVRTKLSAPLAGMGNAKTDSRGRSRTKMVSQSQRSSSPDKNEGSQSANTNGGKNL